MDIRHTIHFSVELDCEDAVQKLSALTAEIIQMEEAIDNVEDEYEELAEQIGNATDAAEELATITETVKKTLSQQKETAGELVKDLQTATEQSGKMDNAVEGAKSNAKKFGDRLKEVAKNNLLMPTLGKIGEAFFNWTKELLKADNGTRAAIANIKGALLTLVQPLGNVIIPLFTMLANVAMRVIYSVARAISKLFGTTVEESAAAAEALYEETNAIEAVGNAAKNLNGLDEISTWQGNDTGGGASTDDIVAPDFGLKVPEEHMNNLLGLIEAIGLGLLAWKINKLLPTNLKNGIGLFVALYGTIEFVKALVDGFANGVVKENFEKILFSFTIACTGLFAVFRKLGASIGAVVGGIAMLVLAFVDAGKSGWNFQNTLLAVMGVLFAGIGLAAATGTTIWAVIAAIGAVLLAITISAGHGQELIEGLKQTLQGFVDFFAGVFTGDMDRAMQGIAAIFDGVKAVILSLVDSIRDWLGSLIDNLIENADGRLKPLLEWVRDYIYIVFNTIREIVSNVVDACQLIFKGIVDFVAGVFTSDWDRAWAGVVNIFKGIWNGIVSLLEGAINYIIRGVNLLFSQLNRIQIDIPSWVPGIGGKTLGFNLEPFNEKTLPRLATGAVIPPNREFLAILGDQRSGTNIETPEGLLRQIMREELGGRGNTYQVNATANGRNLFRLVIDEAKGEQMRTGRNPFMLT